MNGYITAKQRWVADRQFKAGQPLKYRRTIGGLSKDYVLVAKYTDAIPEMWPAWFENVYPNTWFLPSSLISSTQIWPGDTFIDFSTGAKYINSTGSVLYTDELSLVTIEDIPIVSLVITPFENTKQVKISSAYNGNYDEMKYNGNQNLKLGREYTCKLYKVEGTQTINISVVDTFPLIFSSSINNHSLVFDFLDYTSVSFSGVLPNSTTSTSCTYLFNNTIANYILTISNVAGNITIHRNA